MHNKTSSGVVNKVSGESFFVAMINQNPTVHGNRSYASASKYGRDVSYGRNNFLPKRRNCLKNFSGLRTKDLEDYVIPINEEKPDIVVIHIGSNDNDFRWMQFST